MHSGSGLILISGRRKDFSKHGQTQEALRAAESVAVLHVSGWLSTPSILSPNTKDWTGAEACRGARTGMRSQRHFRDQMPIFCILDAAQASPLSLC